MKEKCILMIGFYPQQRIRGCIMELHIRNAKDIDILIKR